MTVVPTPCHRLTHTRSPCGDLDAALGQQLLDIAEAVTNGNQETGIVDVRGAGLAVVELANGSKLGPRHSLSPA